jgi:hypothetical protein
VNDLATSHDAPPFYGDHDTPLGRTSLGTEATLNALILSRDPGHKEERELAYKQLAATPMKDGSFPALDFGLGPFELGDRHITSAFAAVSMRPLVGTVSGGRFGIRFDALGRFLRQGFNDGSATPRRVCTMELSPHRKGTT